MLPIDQSFAIKGSINQLGQVQAMELLTGKIAGKVDDKGVFPDNSINGRVQNQLLELTRKRLAFSKEIKKQLW